MRYILLILIVVLASCRVTNTYYIVRHAEKEKSANMHMSNDVPLSAEGKQRADALKKVLRNNHIGQIYSTHYIRTFTTAQPLSELIDVPIQLYDKPDKNFIAQLKQNSTDNVLIVGHSNTVDDIVNGLAGKSILKDLPETQYGDLFILERKGKRIVYNKKQFKK